MKRKVVLAFEEQPYSLMYHYIAFPMGIIQGNAKEDITPWLCGRHINCWFDKKWINQFCICITDNFAVSDQIMKKETINVSPELFDALHGDYLQLFRTMIAMGAYPNGSFNEEYIPGKFSYNKGYYSHDFLLIGYDDIAKNFISAGYLADHQFHKFLIPYENMGQAVKSLRATRISYNFWRYNEQAQFKLNLNRIIGDLYDYLHSITSLKIYSKNRIWGMEAIDQLAQLFAETERIDTRYTRGLMEHKFFMRMRMRYLYDHGYLKKEEYFNVSEQIYKISENVRMLSLKYNLTRNQSIVEKICEMIREMQRMESEYLPNVLNELQRCVGGI